MLLEQKFLFTVFAPLLYQDFFECLFVGLALELGFGCDGAVLFVEGDLFYGFGWRWQGFGEVAACDLEGVEEQAGSFGVDVAGGDAADDLAEGDLDGGAIFGFGEGEGGLVASALVEFGFGDGFAGGVMVVAKYFFAQGWTAAAMAGNVDVTALETDV